MSYKITQRKAGPVTIVDLYGKMILGEAEKRLFETVKELITQGERNLLFNLAELSYLDSAGLGTFVKCHKAATTSQGRLKLLHVPEKILHLLRITKLHSFFEIFDDETRAVESYV